MGIEKKKVGWHLPAELVDRVNERAAREQRSPAVVVERALEAALSEAAPPMPTGSAASSSRRRSTSLAETWRR